MKDYVPEGGPAVRTDGDGNVSTDGGDSHFKHINEYPYWDKHPNHASIWPLCLSLMTGVFLFGFTGFNEAVGSPSVVSVATSTVTVVNPAYPVFIVVGLVGVIASAVYWGWRTSTRRRANSPSGGRSTGSRR